MSPNDSDFNSAEGYGANKAAAELVLLESGLPISILRPSKIHGVGARRPREWFFVKRILDRRPLILAKGGRGIESTTASTNLAALILFLATRPGQRILNAADPDVLAVKSMAAIIAGHLNYEWSDVYLLEEAPDGLGRSPWDSPAPVVLDMTSALELGYEPAGDYDSTVRDEINWLADIAIESNAFHLPADFDSEFFDGFFDYEAEDAFLRSEIRQMRQK